jgi:hypothetical protein
MTKAREARGRRRSAGAAGLLLAAATLVLALPLCPARAEELDEVFEEAALPAAPGLRFLGDGGFAWQGDADVDGGGEVQVSRYNLGLAGRTDLGESLQWSNTLFFGVNDYDFDGLALGVSNPWDTVLNLRFGTRLRYALNERWGIAGGGVFIFSPETGADWGNSFTGGGTLGVEYRAGDTFFLSVGVAVISQIEDDAEVTPAVALSWLPHERWALRLGAVPASGGTATGAEVAYRVSEPVEVGLGVLYNERRFRLDDSDGVGQDDNVPVRLRVGWNVTPHLSMHFLGGLVTGGELRLEDERGQRLAQEDHDPAPYVGMRVTGRF